MNSYLVVALGGALGSIARYWATGAAARAFGASFPWGTLIINMLGSLAIGLLAAIPGGRLGVNDQARLFFMTGLCGGFTTFSAFSLQLLELLEQGRLGSAFVYIAASITLCVVAVWFGYGLGRTALG